MIESFGTEGKARILLSDETKYKDATTKAAVVEKYVKVLKTFFLDVLVLVCT